MFHSFDAPSPGQLVKPASRSSSESPPLRSLSRFLQTWALFLTQVLCHGSLPASPWATTGVRRARPKGIDIAPPRMAESSPTSFYVNSPSQTALTKDNYAGHILSALDITLRRVLRGGWIPKKYPLSACSDCDVDGRFCSSSVRPNSNDKGTLHRCEGQAPCQCGRRICGVGQQQ